MKVVISLIGLATVLIGAWPVLNESTLIPDSIKFVPSTGVAYQAIIVVIGLAALLYGLRGGNAKIK